MAGVGQTGYWKSGVWVEDLVQAEFEVSAVATLGDWEGDFVLPPSSGIFGMGATADLHFNWVPEFGPPRGDVQMPPGPPDVVIRDDEGNIIVTDFEGDIILPDEPPEVELP